MFPELPVTVSGFKPDIDETPWLVKTVRHMLTGDGGFTSELALEVRDDPTTDKHRSHIRRLRKSWRLKSVGGPVAENIPPARWCLGRSSATTRHCASTLANVPSNLARRIFSTTRQPRTYRSKLSLLDRKFGEWTPNQAISSWAGTRVSV